MSNFSAAEIKAEVLKAEERIRPYVREREKGIITASSGNHGLAFAYLTKTFDVQGIIFLPKIASKTKIEALRSYGLKSRLYAPTAQNSGFMAMIALKPKCRPEPLQKGRA